MTSSRAPSPCYVALPPCASPPANILEFLDRRFPRVGRATWIARIGTGMVTDEAGSPVTLTTPYLPNSRLRYFREVPAEAPIPFHETIVYHDDNVLVACKPHYLPVTPSGPYVNECLLYRLRKTTGNPDLVLVNRLDRETAGLVLVSTSKPTRDLYYELFRKGTVHKLYEAVAPLVSPPAGGEWIIESRIEKGDRWFVSKEVEGAPNARTKIRLIAAREGLGLYELEPSTGKQHQLRLHMASIGAPIVNDGLYPVLQPSRELDFSQPLQLLAKSLAFDDPVTGQQRAFQSSRRLAMDWR